MIRNGATIWMGLSAAIIFSGCTSSSDGDGVASENANEPVTVKLFRNAMISDEAFKMTITDPLAQKYPHITVELQKDALSGGTLQEAITAGETPDLVMIPHNALPSLQNLDLVEDMTPLLQKHQFDLGRFAPVYLDAVRVLSEHGELYAVPYYTQVNALFYNKDLFDKFGVAYPPDGMTWEEAMELGRTMTRLVDGVQYQGLHIDKISRISFPWSPNMIEAITENGKKVERANVNNETWKKIFDTAYRIQSIPGNFPNKNFYKGEAAMFATVGDAFEQIKAAVNAGTINVGIAQYPSYKELPNLYGMVDEHVILVTKTSKHKDAAMKVIEVMMSDEAQLNASKYFARMSPLNNPEMQKVYGAEYLKGVDVQSIFKSSPAPGTVFSVHYPDARTLLDEEYKLVIEGTKDINTALRDLEERTNKMLEEKQAR